MTPKKFTLLELPTYQGKTLREVKAYLDRTYPNQQATQDDIQAFMDSKPKLPDWTWCHFFGKSGRWAVSYVHWNGDSFDRNARGLDIQWDSNSRVVLLEIGSLPSDPLPPSALSPLGSLICPGCSKKLRLTLTEYEN